MWTWHLLCKAGDWKAGIRAGGRSYKRFNFSCDTGIVLVMCKLLQLKNLNTKECNIFNILLNFRVALDWTTFSIWEKKLKLFQSSLSWVTVMKEVNISLWSPKPPQRWKGQCHVTWTVSLQKWVIFSAFSFCYIEGTYLCIRCCIFIRWTKIFQTQ